MNEPVVINIDGGSRGNPGPSACAFVIPALNHSGSKFLGSKTNNEAEYLALLFALHFAKTHHFTDIHILSDSQLVVKQTTLEFECREKRMRFYHDLVMKEIAKFPSFEITLIKRKHNREADALCNAELDKHS